MGPGVRSTTTEPIAARASARAPNGMPTSWATPSETDAAATPAIIRKFDGATAIGATVLAFPARVPRKDRKHLAVQANQRHRHAVDRRHGSGDLACRYRTNVP